MAKRYENFDIEVVREGEGYSARIRSPRGEARVAFARPLTEQELRILGLSIARGRRTTRSVQTREVDEVKAYGQKLFDALFTGDVLACYHESVSHVRGDPATGLRMRLRLTGAPELAQVPWEYLYDRRSNRFLALDDETPIVRYLDLPLPAGPLAVSPPLRILVMIASPNDVPGLDADREWRLLHDALGDLVRDGAVQLHRLERATIGALRWQLRADEYHVFHFIGHGGVDAITDRGVLVLEDDAGASDVVEAEVIAGILAGERTLRLAVLNACEGGRASKGDIFAGTAQSLVQQDLPAVIAMQFEISDQAAIALTHDFYKALAFGDPVDAALTEARRGLRYQLRNELEWGTPVLYMRSADGRLFDVAAPPQPAPRPAPEPAVVDPPRHVTAEPDAVAAPAGGTERLQDRRIGELLHAAQLAVFAEKWGEATSKLEEVLELDPDHGQAAEKLAEVRREEQLAVLYRTGVEHESAGRHGDAIEAFQRLRKLAGTDYRGVDERIRTLREAARAKRKPRQVLWIRIGKFAAGVWALGLLAIWLVPDDSVEYAIEPPLITPTDVTGPGGAVTTPPDPVPQPQPQIPQAGAQVSPSVGARGVDAAAPPNTSPSRDAEAAQLGLSRYGSPIVGTLRPGGSVVHDVRLEAGLTYVIGGSCDQACGDLDLLISEQGVVRFQDVEPDAMPVLMTPVLVTGTYQLTVQMASCAATACGYRVQVYR